jgi:hypothetical protein
MTRPRIVLSGVSPKVIGLQWESDQVLRIGRQPNVDIFLEDPSVSRQQAEVVTTGRAWVVRDLANQERSPTLLNGNRVLRTEQPLQLNDLIQCGNHALRVTTLEVPEEAPQPIIVGPEHIKASGVFMKVQAKAQRTWEEALEVVTLDRQRPANSQHLLTLLRTGFHVGRIASLDELLNQILTDAIKALDAQRGSIVLADPKTGELKLAVAQSPRLGSAGIKRPFSRTIAERCFTQGESLLCRDVNIEPELAGVASVQCGAMASIVCAMLRTPRRPLGVLQLDRGHFQDPFDESDFYLADAIAATVAVGIESAQLVQHERAQFLQTVTALARTVDVRDSYTGDHTRRVTDYSLLLADALRLPPPERYHIEIGAPLHDIGKIGIDDAILRKPGKLTDEEYERMKQHTVLGANILQSIHNLAPMIPIVRHHHERWDGRGYPDGLAREQISQTARIVAVADAFDAMTSDRPYRRALSADAAFAELVAKAGTHFDPACANTFVRLRTQVEALMRRT